MERELIQRKTELSENVLAFSRYLRSKGFPLGPGEISDTLLALSITPFSDPERFRLCLRSILPKSLAQQELFDEFYEEYWRNLSKAVDSKVKDVAEEKEQRSKQSAPPKGSGPSLQALKSWLYGSRQDEEMELASYSAQIALGEKDFSAFGDDELYEILQIVNLLAKALASKQQRRYRQLTHSGRLDLRRSLRKNLRRGGEMLELAFRKRRIRKMKLVMLCDVSKSMDLYSRFLVQFIYGFQSAYKQIETFVFSTSLYHVSEQLRSRNLNIALQRLSQDIGGWSGGTKIGESLFTFISQYDQFLDGRTIVLIMSDGWDTGETSLIENSMAYIQKKAAKVVWLNPLAGNPNFSPEVAGMAAAMPFIDVFAPAHNIDSLRQVTRYLGKS